MKETFFTYSKEYNYYLTPQNRARPNKLTGSQLVKKFSAFYEIRKFITAFTTTCPSSEPKSPTWKNTPRLSETVYSICSQVPSILEVK